MLKRAHWLGGGALLVVVPLVGLLHGGCQPTCERSSDCPQGTFCFIGPDQCAQAVPLGFCTDISNVCSDATVTVCGCDDKTYLNACVASENLQSYAATGACIPTACMSSADCKSDELCSFATVGICAGEGVAGVCVTIPKTCENNFQPVCGCDGKTYQNICEAQHAGQSLLAATSCSCQYNDQCPTGWFCNFSGNGVVAGTGCLAESPTGFCSQKPTSCTSVPQPVCGCDGNPYLNPCAASQQGVNVALMGACPAGVGPDGGADGG